MQVIVDQLTLFIKICKYKNKCQNLIFLMNFEILNLKVIFYTIITILIKRNNKQKRNSS